MNKATGKFVRVRLKLWAGLLGIALSMGVIRAGAQATNNCTESDLRNSATNGGIFLFSSNCSLTLGGGPVIVSSAVIFNAASNGAVTLSGSGDRIFIVESNAVLALNGFVLRSGTSTNGGAILVEEGGTVVLTNCVFTGNSAAGADGDDGEDAVNGTNSIPFVGRNGGKGTSGESAFGGAIYNLGDLSILNCRFVTNNATGGNGGNGGAGTDGSFKGGNGGSGGEAGSAFGGAIYSAGERLLIVNSTFDGNSVSGGTAGAGGDAGGGGFSGPAGNGGKGGNAFGAGLYTFEAGGPAVIIASTFSANTAQAGDGTDRGASSTGFAKGGFPGGSGNGGGIWNGGFTNLVMTNCTFSQNRVFGGAGGTGGAPGTGIGGGIYNTGLVSVVNCTLSMNGASGGTNTDASGVTGGHGKSLGGNIANVASKKNKGAFFLQNSIVGKTSSGNSSSGTIADGGFNICADKSIKFTSVKKGGTSRASLDPLVGSLADNTGPTKTIGLFVNSPAVDAIPITNVVVGVDQRGIERPQFVRTNAFAFDIGAFELDTNLITILVPPQSTNVLAGSNATFSVTASGGGTLFYQWLSNSVIIPAATNTFITITNVQPTNSGSSFQVIVTNSTHSVTSAVAVLTVSLFTNTAPTITNAPASQTNTVGSTVNFTVGAAGTQPFFYQWVFQSFQDGVFTNLFGATNSVLTLVNVQTTNSGNYFVVVTNSVGSATSTPAVLTVTTNSGGIGLPSLLIAPEKTMMVPLGLERTEAAPASFNFAFPSQPGAIYVIEYKQSLSDPFWVPIMTNSGDGGWLTNQLPVGNQPNGFFRVISP